MSLVEEYAKQKDADLRAQLATVDGRRFLWTLIDERSGTGVLGGTFSGADTHRAAYLEGRRAMGVELMADCQRVSPSETVQMLRESFQRRAEIDAERPDGGAVGSSG